MFPDKTEQLRIEVDLVAEMAVLNPFDFFLEPYAEHFPFAYTAEEQSELAPYLAKAPASPRFAEYLASIPRVPVQYGEFSRRPQWAFGPRCALSDSTCSLACKRLSRRY